MLNPKPISTNSRGGESPLLCSFMVAGKCSICHVALRCTTKSFPCLLTVWAHNIDWTVLELISGIWIFMSPRDETQRLINAGLVLPMWKRANGVWWCNQLKARHKTPLFTKTSEWVSEEAASFGAFVQLMSGPRTAPLLFYRMEYWFLRQCSAEHNEWSFYPLTYTHSSKHKDMSGLCQ